MTDYNNIPSLRQYVRVKTEKNTKELEEAGLRWMKAMQENHLQYEYDWFGIPIIQTPEDIVLMQELIFRIKPDIIIECGIGHGGALIFYASLLELLGKGKVIGVDIEIREHNRKALEAHPLFNRIELLEGSSISDEIIKQLSKKVPKNSKTIVCLDSNHYKAHVLQELKVYQQFIMLGCYIVVFDSNSSQLAKVGACDKTFIDNGPMEAIDEFLASNENFEIDKSFNKLFISANPNGYLRRIK